MSRSTPSSPTRIAVESWTAPTGRDVCLVGVGARTPLGFDAATSAAAVRAAISAVGMHPFFLDKVGDPVEMACDPGLPAGLAAGLDIADRMTTMLVSAMSEALQNATFGGKETSIPCWIGFPELRPGVSHRVTQSVSSSVTTELGLRPEKSRLLAAGHSSGLIAMQAAAKLISAGDVNLCLVAGVDSYHSRETLDWLDNVGALASRENRGGFSPGEAASACLLASRAATDRYQLPVFATVTAAATAIEPHPIRGEEVCIGEGLSAVLTTIISSLPRRQQTITATYCDLNGERYRSEELTYTLLRTQQGFVDAHDYQCPADCWGDVGAASGLLFACLAVASKQRGYARGSIPVLWAGSESGHRAAVLLDLGEDAQEMIK